LKIRKEYLDWNGCFETSWLKFRFSGDCRGWPDGKTSSIEYTVARFPIAASDKSLIMGGQELIKLVAGKQYGQILKVQIIGPRAMYLITEFVLAIGMESLLDELAAHHSCPSHSERGGKGGGVGD
jgi:pyruvate/2-oxoglutarate dehydrogenase complex dihydrolipoamide dehydrogenase (E3) component